MKLPTKERLKQAFATAKTIFVKDGPTILWLATNWRRIVVILTTISGSTWFMDHMGWLQPAMDALASISWAML